MVVRRSGSRRRRVVIDEVTNRSEGRAPSVSSAPVKTTSKKVDEKEAGCDSRLYTFGAGRRGQRKTTDFVPKRLLPFSLVVLALVAILAALNGLAILAPSWEPWIGEEGVRMLSLTGVGSLGSWFASALFILSGVTCLQVLALRKHRCDDYRGTYRVWLWMAGVMFLASLHFTVDIGAVAKNLLESATQQSVYNKIWLVVTFKLVLLTLLSVRAAFEIKESRGALIVAIVAWFGFVFASLLPVPVIKESLMVDYETVYGNVVLFASVGLLLANMTYARFVFLQANGLIKPRVHKEKVVARKELETATKKKSSRTSSKSKKSGTQDEVTEQVTEEPVVEKVTKRTTKKKATKLKVAVPEEAHEEEVVEDVAPKVQSRPPVPKPSRPPVPKPTKSSKKKQTMDEAERQEILSITPEQYASMSKSERRRHRKLEKRMKRAA